MLSMTDDFMTCPVAIDAGKSCGLEKKMDRSLATFVSMNNFQSPG